MARLIAKSPLGDALPIAAGDQVLDAADVGLITSVAPFDGAGAALSAALQKAHGLAFPAAGQVSEAASGARCVWTGRGQAMLLGTAPDDSLAADAALTDQTDGWTVLRLSGPRAAAVLARLAPIDLRAGAFGPGQAARTQIGHMMAVLICAGEQRYEIMVFRSMTRTALHELETAMKSVAARG